MLDSDTKLRKTALECLNFWELINTAYRIDSENSTFETLKILEKKSDQTIALNKRKLNLQIRLQARYPVLAQANRHLTFFWEILDNGVFKDNARAWRINTNDIHYGCSKEIPYLEARTVNRSHTIQLIWWREHLICVTRSIMPIGYLKEIKI